MKKTLYLAISIIVIISLAGCGETSKTTKGQVDNNTNIQDTSTQTNSDIDIQKAKEIALKDAGFSEKDVTDLSTEKDDDEDKYDISFKNGGKEYDYDISLSGEILDKNVEIDD